MEALRDVVEAAEAEIVIQFEGWVQRVALASAPVVLGRGDDCDVRLRDPAVSRRHCRFAPDEGGGWTVEDLGSQAGTLLSGVPLQGRAPFRPGDALQVGPMQIRLELKPEGAKVLSGNTARDARNVELLLRTVDDLYGTEDLAELLRTIVDRAIALAGGDRGGLLLSEPQGRLEAGVARDSRGGDLPPDERLGRTLPRRALKSGRAVVLTDTEASGEEELPESVAAGQLRSVLCVPLPGPEGPVGVLYVDSHRPAEEFGAAELAIFEALAVHGSLALERTRLREEQARRELDHRLRLEDENATLRAQLGAEAPVGESAAVRGALDLVRRIAPSEATVLLTGETGTGKEVLARYLHRLSPRSGGPFVVVDCGAIPESLIESELFGHEKGSFTGAGAARLGRFREANGGTVFLDEIAELPMALQSRLLRVIQEHTIQPVGATGRETVDVRVVCATHRDLAQRVAADQFRQDLYYRIAVITVPMPPLRERGQDILLLAHHFLARFASLGTRLTGFTREASEALLEYGWPGNVRELENRVHRGSLLARTPYVTRQDLGLAEEGVQDLAGPTEAELPNLPLQEARAQATELFERAYLEQSLRRAAGNVSRAAELAGITRQVFHRMMARHAIERERFTPS